MCCFQYRQLAQLAQDSEVGDGTTSVVIIAAELFLCCKKLLAYARGPVAKSPDRLNRPWMRGGAPVQVPAQAKEGQ